MLLYRQRSALSWMWRPASAKRISTRTQCGAALTALRVSWTSDLDVTGINVDIGLPAFKVAIEVDGPMDFSCNTHEPLGAINLKRRLLSRLGWSVATLETSEWPVDERQQQLYVLAILKGVGLSRSCLPSSANLDPVTPFIAQSNESTDTDSLVRIASDDSVREASLRSPEEAEAIRLRAARNDMVSFRRGRLSRAEMLHRIAMRTPSRNT